jgi:3-oxoacyl-[acyl-carrier protein] reductase
MLGLGAVADIDPSLWRRVIDVDLVAPMLWNRAVLAGMRARRRGRIINVTSVGSLNPSPYGSAYAAAKAGLNQLTNSLAAEVADDGIAVFALSPAAHTDMGRELYENDVMPEKQRAGLRAYMTTDPDALMQRSLELFRFVAAGGADELTGQYVGVHMGRSETPDDLRARVTALATT